jgi:hypothetical protein
MDDDLRNRFRAPRRDYAMPPSRPQPSSRPQAVAKPAAQPNQPPAQKPHHAPTQNPFLTQQPAPAHKPAHHTKPLTHTQPAHHQSHKVHPQPIPSVMSGQTIAHHPSKPHQPPKTVATPQPVQPHHAAQSHHAKKRGGWAKKWLIGLLVLLIIGGIAATGALWAYPKYVKTNPFTADIQSNAKMGLFYPDKMPDGYSVNKSSIHTANGAVIYNAYNGDKKLVFTIQKAPPSFNFGKFYDDQLKNAQQFSTPNGEAVIGKNDNRYLGSISSDGSWLLLSTNSQDVTYDDMALVMHNLKKY